MGCACAVVPRRVGLVCLLAVLVGPSAALAGSDYSDKDFSVRLPPAFLRFREVTTSGGETAANRWSSAINPASADWMDLPCKLGLVVAPYYSHVQFGEGTRLHVVGESLTWDAGDLGTFQPTLSQIRSNSETDKLGLDFNYEVDTVQLVWAKRFGDWGVGALVNLAEAEIIHDLGPVRVSEAHGESYRVRLGALYEPAEKWLTGLIFEYGFAPARATVLAPTPLGLMPVRLTDTHHQFVLRPGVSYEYAEYSTAYLDYQYGVFFNDDDSLHSHRFNTGVDHRLLDWLFVRLGGSMDTRGNAGWSCGLGIYFSEWCSLDIGYQSDTLPELRPEFGRSQTFQVAVALRL